MAAAPDTALARAATDLLTDCAPEVLVNHCQRVYQWSCALGENRNWQVDPELLYLEAMLHDLGVTERFDGPESFEVEGGNAAEKFLLEHGYPKKRAETVKEATLLHVDPTTFQDPRHEVALLAMACAMENRGEFSDEFDADFVDAVLRKWPRQAYRDYTRRVSQDHAERKPDSLSAQLVESGVFERKTQWG
ncbi:HD domain-containing protein [Nocardia sp. CDC159]|uniref:HD domain-containing protein n=2 Tax=Nocardia pulmonis TaxID=2951408 RepID=A0A9X2EEE3_9NOCA|nr:HD domain-containing protein [Nocardia sp. CDC159]MCM6776611.1 HD domain-containing protein [Nocardia pulmonis]MCM6789240.1 HD domain-containing protein [Nocardia sp. CDC159]